MKWPLFGERKQVREVVTQISAGARLCPQDQSQRVEADGVRKNLRLVLAEVLRLVCNTAALRGKAAVNAPQSRRLAMSGGAG
jgi:hypothetical protein